MKCPRCNKEFNLQDAEITTDVVEYNNMDQIDIQVDCPNCNEQAFFAFVNDGDLTPNENI